LVSAADLVETAARKLASHMVCIPCKRRKAALVLIA
jgi:hypothetical protein